MSLPASAAAQDYLKSLYLLSTETGRPAVPTKAVAEHLGVSPASATNMLKRLAEMGLASHVPYRGTELTTPGRKIALEVIRHHRLLETYLAAALGVPWDAVHAEAEILEHVLSEDLEDRIADLLGHPTSDPHGHPIPDKELTMPDSELQRLWDVADGATVSIERVPDSDAEALRYLADIGIRPGARIVVVGKGPVAGPLFVRLDGDGPERALSKELAGAVWVD